MPNIKNRMNKKGLADVVATISLVLITTIAAVMVSSQINNFFFASEVQLSDQTSCLDLQSSLVVQIKKACYNVEEKDIELTLERKVSAIEISEIDFTINSETGSESYSCSNSCGNCNVLGLGATKIYYFEAENFENGEAAIHINGCNLDEIEITESC